MSLRTDSRIPIVWDKIDDDEDDRYDNPEGYDTVAFASGIPCTVCGNKVGDVPFLPKGAVPGDVYRIPIRCPNGHVFDFSLEIIDDEDKPFIGGKP